MKILMLTPYVPYPPSSGGQIRTFNLLKYLSKRHQITLIALYKNEEEKKYKKFLNPYCKQIYLCQRPPKPWTFKNIFRAIFSFYPFLVIRNFSEEAKKLIENILNKENFDVIHAETFYVMPHIPETKIPIVLVEQTIEYKVYQHFLNSLPLIIQFFLYFDILKLIHWERFYWRKASIVGTVSGTDEKVIKELEKNIKTALIPNGAGDEMIVKKLPKKNLKNPLIIFQGNFNWLQNIEAAKFLINQIFPLLIKIHPNIKLLISGQNADKIKISRNSKIEIINLSLDKTYMVKSLYQKATIFIAPIFGPGGTRLKILAAMASGLPVISSPTGVEGLAVEDGKHVLIAKNEKEFVKKILLLLKNKNFYESLRKNAYQLVLSKYNWKKIAEKLGRIYQQLKK
ncbi:MAG: glycosyltransferase family 4 protein [Microgenomates group bacterium]